MRRYKWLQMMLCKACDDSRKSQERQYEHTILMHRLRDKGCMVKESLILLRYGPIFDLYMYLIYLQKSICDINVAFLQNI